MSSPLGRFNQNSPEERARYLRFLEQELIRLRQEMNIAMVKNPSRMVELGIAAQNLENEIRKIRSGR